MLNNLAPSIPVQDRIHVDVREGMIIHLTSGEFCTPGTLFMLTLFCSISLEGKPVHCSGLLPGVSVVVRAQTAGMDASQRLALVERGWDQIKPQLDQWIEVAEQLPCLNSPIDGATVVIALDRQIQLGQGAMRIVAAPVWEAAGHQSPVQVAIPVDAVKMAISAASRYKWSSPW